MALTQPCTGGALPEAYNKHSFLPVLESKKEIFKKNKK